METMRVELRLSLTTISSTMDENDVVAAKLDDRMPLRSSRTGLTNKGERAHSPLLSPRAFTGVPYLCATHNQTLLRDTRSTIALSALRVSIPAFYLIRASHIPYLRL